MTSLKDFSLEGKNAWITGASYGIGFNIAKAFVAAGIKTIIFNDINEAALERGLANYKEAGIENVKGYVCDVTDEEGVKALVEKVHAEVGQIDILVNNAGVGYYGIHETLSPDEISTMVRTNLEVPLILSNLLVSTLKKNNGFIINISSHTATAVNPHGCAYGATKAGLFSFSKSLFEEERKYGLKVIDIQPDMTDTNLYRNANFGVANDVLAYLAPDDVANAVKYAVTQRDGCAITCINLKPQLNRISRNK